MALGFGNHRRFGQKTGRCVIVHEATRTSGFGAELTALVSRTLFLPFRSAYQRVTGWDTPYPHAQEWDYFGPCARRRNIQTCDGEIKMGIHVIKMPDIGEGIAEVELVAWHVKPGDNVSNQVMADVMTDKATIEIPSPVNNGKVLALGGAAGQVMAVGSELIRIEVEGAGNVDANASMAPAAPAAPATTAAAPAASTAAATAPAKIEAPAPATAETRRLPTKRALKQAPIHKKGTSIPAAARANGEKPIASPAVRRRAWDLGIELRLCEHWHRSYYA